MQIRSKASIRAAYQRAIDLGATDEEAIESAAQATGLPIELVREALDGQVA